MKPIVNITRSPKRVQWTHQKLKTEEKVKIYLPIFFLHCLSKTLTNLIIMNQDDKESTLAKDAKHREKMIPNLYVLFTFHTDVVYRCNETGSDYFHTFAQHLQKEFMEKPAHKIFALIDQSMKVSYKVLTSYFNIS